MQKKLERSKMNDFVFFIRFQKNWPSSNTMFEKLDMLADIMVASISI